MRVFVYFNLHRKMWSIKALEGPDKGRVVQHSRYVILRNVKPKVSQKGRERVLREKRENVHAGLVGELDSVAMLYPKNRAITYNPYKYTSFVYCDNESPFEGSDTAVLAGRSVTVA